MKNLKYILMVFMGLILFHSCEDDIEYSVPTDAVKPELTSNNEGTFILQKVNETADFQTFEWSAADFKLKVSPQYNLEVDVKGGDFIGHKTIASGITSPYTISVGDFNKGLLGAGFKDGQTYEIDVRIVYGNYLASEPVSMNVTTYFDAEPWSLIGSAVGGWNPENDKFMDYDKESDTYSMTLDMKPGEFKFRASKKNSDPWKYNLGLDADGPEQHDNGADIQMKDGGENIQVSGGNYTVTLSVGAKTFSIKQNSAAAYTDWSAAKLDAVGDGVSADNTNATEDGSSWGWGNVLVADAEGLPTKELTTYTWTWKGIILEANKGFKIRTLNGENASNDIGFNIGSGAIDVEASTVKAIADGDNITVTEKGAYDITVTIDAANGDAKKIVIAEPAPEYPAELFMIGDGVGTWTWEENDLPMVPVNGKPNMFWKIVWMNATGGFKMSPQKEWKDNDFGCADDSAAKEEYDKGTKNIPVPGTEGYYMVVVDLDANKISVTSPKVYLIGDVVGGYDGGGDANLFTVDNDNEKLTITKDLSAGDLRMYISHPYISDWWRAEFIILDGKIVPRGNGGDQDRVSVAGVSTTIDLNFKTMTGTITQ